MPSGTVGEYEDILGRLRAVPVLVTRPSCCCSAASRGITPPRITLRDVPSQAQDLVVEDPVTSPLLAASRIFGRRAPADQQRLRTPASPCIAIPSRRRSQAERVSAGPVVRRRTTTGFATFQRVGVVPGRAGRRPRPTSHPTRFRPGLAK